MMQCAKKCLSVLMALVMVLSMFSITGTDVTAAGGNTVTVYLENTRKWGPIYCYYWSDSNTQMTAWPGVKMQHEAAAYYSLAIPAQAQYVIFTDGTEQTADLTFPGGGYIYNETTDSWTPYNGCTHDWGTGAVTREPDCTTDGRITYTCALCRDTYQTAIPALGHDYDAGICQTCGNQEPGSYSLYFRNTEGWEQVRFYCWGDNFTLMTWPGEIAVSMGEDVYLAKVPYSAQFIIFNDGGSNQTADLIVPCTGDHLYDISTGDWQPYQVACHHVLHLTQTVTPAGCTQDGLNRHVCTLCAETVDVIVPALGHDYADGVCTRCGADEETCTVYFDLGSNAWGLVYYYWWISGHYGEAWPGSLMTPLGEGIYSAEVPADVEGIIFNNGMGSQTGDLQLPGDGCIYRLDSDRWDYYSQQQENLVTVYFNHAFQYCDCLNVRYSGSTTGYIPMECVGGTVYRAQVPADAQLRFECDCGPVGHVASIPGDGYILYPADGTWEHYNGCAHQWDEGQIRDEWTCEQDEVTVYSCLHCESEFNTYKTAYGHNYVDFVCQNCGREVPETVTLYLDGAKDWDNVYAFVWNKNESLSAWPGIKMEAKGDWYAVEVPGCYQYITFSDGDQVNTGELSIPGDGYIYDLESESWTTLPKTPVPGDTTGDGTLDIMDVVNIYTYVSKGAVPEGCDMTNADVNGDGAWNVVDVAMMYAHVKGTRLLW